MSAAEKRKTADRAGGFTGPDVVLNALPHAVLTVGRDGHILDANVAAEAFFHVSKLMLRRHRLTDLVPFGSALLSLVEDVRVRRSPVAEYRVDLGSPRTGERVVDIYVSPMPEDPGSVVVMLQERTIADKMDRQLTHRGAARSVTALAAMLAHEIKNPLSGIRGAAQLLEQSVDGRGPGADPPDLRRDRPHRQAGRPHGGVRRRAAGRSRAGQHPCRAGARQTARRSRVSRRNIRFVEEYDPSLPPVLGNRDQLIQVFLNLVKNAAEAIGPEATDGEIELTTAFRPGVRLAVPGTPDARQPAAGVLRARQRPRRAGRPAAASVRPVRDHQADRNRPGTCTGGEDRRRPWRDRRVRLPAAPHRRSAS